ncbi:unnamed protein product [Durusdinium trenchii]|uniref:HhH-GPD domain-containing protein n=2 Tax=Durusdinium trenchii TaxID=1381693 RepID=A0ABP0S6B8_9DINO
MRMRTALRVLPLMALYALNPGPLIQGPMCFRGFARPRTPRCTLPLGMEEHIELIKELRKDRSAPVDSMGVRAIHNTSKDSYETLVALILSTRTKDSATYETIQVLRHHGLTPLNILKTPALTLTSLLAKVNHRNRKASYLREMSEMLMNNFGGRVPDQEWQLRKLKGVGEKSALLYLQTVTGKVTGIAVDAHLHSIANWLSWVETKRPHQTRKKLEQRLPRTLWGPINPLVVGFGQELAREKQKILHKCLRSSMLSTQAWMNQIKVEAGKRRDGS